MLKKTLEALIFCASFNVGCGVVQQINENQDAIKLREEGYNPYHSVSCGPTAIVFLLKEFGIHKQMKEVSKEILDKSFFGNFLRYSLGAIHKSGMEITLPKEMEKTLERYFSEEEFFIRRYNAMTSTEMASLIRRMNNENKKGIALLKNTGLPFSYHWLFFNGKNDITIHYGKNTLVCRFYVVERKVKTNQSSEQEQN